jgi:hypothetical protein
MKFIAIMSFMLMSSAAVAASDTLDKALKAMSKRDFDKALPLWEQLGNEGDKKAMIEAALIYHHGLGRPVNHEKALDWYLRAMNGDTYNNMGVMFRDGAGLPQNRKIAYLMFLTVHMEGMGGEATISRANRNLRREVAELPEPEIKEALCYTPENLLAYMKSRGKIEGMPEELRASPERKRIKELGWWREGEVPAYECTDGT